MSDLSVHSASAVQSNTTGTNLSVPTMVAAQATARPQALAVHSRGRVVTYHELDSRATQIAEHLQGLGIGPETIVGVYLERTIEMVVCLLGILKAGAAYLPIDPAQPDERIATIVNDADCALVVTSGGNANRFRVPTHILGHDEDFNGTPAGRIPVVATATEDLAYVVYTSGSSGTPKGVCITHAALSNLVNWHQKAFCVTPADRASHVAALGFDAAVWELWPYLASGAGVYLADDETRVHPEKLRDWLVANHITIAFSPTPMAERLMTLPWPRQTRLRALLTGGDTLHVHPPAALPFSVVNNYGPTECTVVATSGVVPTGDHQELPTIGTPIENVCLHVLDEQRRPLPDGAEGELFIGGACVARGYLNCPAATAEKFVSDPFHSGGRMYRTGDLARRLPDGRIAFLGRIDDQIKVRGYRVELQEIVLALNAHSAVQASSVIAQNGAGEETIVAYIVPTGRAKLTRDALQEFLRLRLPDYMVPSTFVVLDSLPLTSNGKVDRAMLPPVTAGNVLDNGATECPGSIAEEHVAAIVAGLLGLERVDRDDNFFMLGGHSLLATQLIVLLRSAFGVEVPLRTLFNKPTIADLAETVEFLINSKPLAQQ
jgi:amino acid adenylation domain-containing protein